MNRITIEQAGHARRILRTIQWGMVVALILLSFALPAAADDAPGGKVEVVLVGPLGPYSGTVWVSPAPPLQTGRNSVVITLQDPSRYFERVLDAEVAVTVTPPSGGTPITQQALHENALDERNYAAHFVMDEPGEWSITVQVSGDQGEGEASVQVNAEPRRYTLLIIAGAALLAAIVAYVKWGRDPLPSGDNTDDPPKKS